MQKQGKIQQTNFEVALKKKSLLWNIFLTRSCFPHFYLGVEKILLDQQSWPFFGLGEKENNVETKVMWLLTDMIENWVPLYPCVTARGFSTHTEKKPEK